MTRPAQCAFCSGEQPGLKECQVSYQVECSEWAEAYDEGVADERERHSMPVEHFDVLLELYPITLGNHGRCAVLDAIRHQMLVLAVCRGDVNVPLLDGVYARDAEDDTEAPP
ncbi:MAG TPA: hypothetical protein VGO53_16275 [Steroidobacteraceae bacterium]|jgi:hypothetical protein|nr:hypothetical protein [Steroidobacteraceae bacterium]